MKKLFTQIIKKNGELKDVYVCVDDETAKVLEQVDDETRRTYLQEEWQMKTVENRTRRNEQSLEKSLDNGFDIVDEDQNVEEIAIKNSDREMVRNAIKELDPQQQWIVNQLYICGKKQTDIAREMGIGKSAMSQRMSVIKTRLKKLLKNF